MLNQGADGVKFINVGCGPNTSYAAHAPFTTGHTIAHGDFVKVDMGALCQGYGADFVRSYFVGMSLRPGVTGGEIFDRGYTMISKYLENFPREFIGHGIGIGAHEEPRMNHVNKTVLEPGTVYCIEYSYYHEGVRHHTEETFLLTEDGVECWTEHCPRDLVVEV